jgi:hypothetical protein
MFRGHTWFLQNNINTYGTFNNSLLLELQHCGQIPLKYYLFWVKWVIKLGINTIDQCECFPNNN